MTDEPRSLDEILQDLDESGRQYRDAVREIESKDSALDPEVREFIAKVAPALEELRDVAKLPKKDVKESLTAAAERESGRF